MKKEKLLLLATLLGIPSLGSALEKQDAEVSDEMVSLALENLEAIQASGDENAVDELKASSDSVVICSIGQDDIAPANCGGWANAVWTMSI